MIASSLSLVLEWLSSRSHLIQLAVALSLLLLFPSIFKVLWKQWRIFKAFQKVPSDPRHQHLILGHAPKFLSDMGEALDWVRQISLENSWKTLKIRIGPGIYFLVGNHPDAAQIMLRSAFKYEKSEQLRMGLGTMDPKSDQIYEAFVPWLGRGLLVANGKRWARARRLLTPAFHFDILRPYIKVYNDAARVLVSQWRETPEGESFNVYHSISLFTLDVMLRCSCSFESDCQISKSHSRYISAVYQLSDLSTTRAMSPLLYYDLIYMMTPSYWKYRKACKTVHGYSMDVIKKRRAKLEESKKQSDGSFQGTKRKYLDFIDILLEARDENNVGLTDLEIRAEVDTFMFEGHDTTSNGIAWTLYNLATHPEHQEKCRQEVDAIFSEKDENDEDVTSDDMKQLVHLKYCIKESLRLFPPVSVVGRVLDQDTNITGYAMPKGTSVNLSIYAIHRHPDFWENPDEFDPLRFTPENSKGRHPHAFVPFSAGPRNCIGQEFALNEERVALAHILRKFEISLDESKPIKKEFLIILRPKPGLFLKLKRRDL